MSKEDESLKRDYAVMIVDDDQFLLDMYAMKFSECGCTVDAMSDSEQALEKLRSGYNPSMILLDVMMPKVDGFAFLEAIKNENLAQDATVIMLTNQGQQEDIEKAMSLGAGGYIVKASAIPSEVLKKAIELTDNAKK